MGRPDLYLLELGLWLLQGGYRAARCWQSYVVTFGGYKVIWGADRESGLLSRHCKFTGWLGDTTPLVLKLRGAQLVNDVYHVSVTGGTLHAFVL